MGNILTPSAMFSALRSCQCQDASVSGGAYTEADGLALRGLEIQPDDTFMDKLQRDWLVPIGVGTTAVVLASGLNSFRNGNSVKSQYFMRARIVAQGFSLVAIMWSLHYETTHPHPNRRGGANSTYKF